MKNNNIKKLVEQWEIKKFLEPFEGEKVSVYVLTISGVDFSMSNATVKYTDDIIEFKTKNCKTNMVIQAIKSLEIDETTEVAGKVPSEEDKINSTKISLRSYLNLNIIDSFTDIDENDDEEMDKRIDEIVSWIDEDPTPGRGEVMSRLAKLNVKEDRIEDLTDSILFTYLKFARWTLSDNLNLAIGQGENAYTPSQVVRYVMAIANGGYLTDLTLTKKIVNSDYEITYENEVVSKKIDFKNSDNLKELTKGMKLVTSQGTAAKYFVNFPIEVAAKSGTAERKDKIPTADEYNYLMDHLSSYGVEEKEVLKVYKQL